MPYPPGWAQPALALPALARAECHQQSPRAGGGAGRGRGGVARRLPPLDAPTRAALLRARPGLRLTGDAAVSSHAPAAGAAAASAERR